MKSFENKLYNDLMTLTNDVNNGFYHVDKKLNDQIYRIFSYRLVSWTDMQLPNAKNCRGTMFNITNNDPVLVSLPPEKFFNDSEGGIDHLQYPLGCIMTKMDGSLISTYDIYPIEDSFALKSKTSLNSEQAIAATKWLDKPENKVFKDELRTLTCMGYTVNMEWTSPSNRIVVPYQEDKLTVLSIRDMMGGSTYYGDNLLDFINSWLIEPEILNHLVEYNNFIRYDREQYTSDVVIDLMRTETEGEGYVVEILAEQPYLVKVKNYNYLTLHKTKDSVNTPSKLFEAVINECTDDLRTLFATDPYSLQLIDDMEKKVMPIYNKMISEVEDFHHFNNHMDRKTYAIMAKATLPNYMSLCMNIYLGKENDFKDFAIKRREEIFHITNVEIITEE